MVDELGAVKKLIRNLSLGDCGRGELCEFCSDALLVQIASGPWPMQLVVPRAVRAAVRMLMTN